MALAAYAAGRPLLLALRAQAEPLAARVARIGRARSGRSGSTATGWRGLNRLSDRCTTSRCATCAPASRRCSSPAGVLVVGRLRRHPDARRLRRRRLPLRRTRRSSLVLLATAVAAVATTRPRDHLRSCSALSGVGLRAGRRLRPARRPGRRAGGDRWSRRCSRWSSSGSSRSCRARCWRARRASDHRQAQAAQRGDLA